MTSEQEKKEVNELKKKMITVSYNVKQGHLASGASIMDIMYVLFKDVMRYDVTKPDSLDNDIFVLSKGHASIGLYTILARFGFIEESELDTFCQFHSRLGGHPDCNKIPGVYVSTGSLGHGFPIAMGIAYGSKIRGTNNMIYSVIGDGEMNEGTIWETLLLAGNYQLNNLCCILDNNNSIQKAVNLSPIADKLKSFNWEVIEINGHDHDELRNAFLKPTDKPKAIIANTIKGYGLSDMEANAQLWHHKSPNDEEYKKMMKELL